ncbi:MAG: arylsulfatase [Enterobacteriaceae bacterium]
MQLRNVCQITAITILSATLFSQASVPITLTEQGTIYGTPGDPDSVMVIDDQILPPVKEAFYGKIGKTTQESKPYWQPRVAPKAGAPHVLLIITDDMGYGVPSTFGGIIPTPTLDRIAKSGLRYTNFHSTGLSTPTRAALLTGRNHHSVGFGIGTELATGFPGYNSLLGKEHSTLGTILRENGYRTAWFGKNSLTPLAQSSQAGPYDQWPVGLGFEYFYGFLGETSGQWEPGTLVRNITPVYPLPGHPDWNMTTALAEDAIDYIHRIDSAAPAQPFFIKFAPAGAQAPHHPSQEWIDKITEMHLFDKGWNQIRQQIFNQQKKLALIPASTKMPPWPKTLFKEWQQLTPEEQKVLIRQAEVYAAWVAYTDHEIGRVIDAIDKLDKLDNTLIIYISGANGSNASSLTGTVNDIARFNGLELTPETALTQKDKLWDSNKSYPQMAAPWAWMFNTPFAGAKEIVSYLGGIRQPLVISWPRVIKNRGGIRQQFHHVIDIAPTILEATAIQEPHYVNGIQQNPFEGISMMYTLTGKKSKSPSRHTTQYFEIMGNRAIYHEGWFAGTRVVRYPWTLYPTNTPLLDYTWELYDLNKDWAQSNNLAAKQPKKLQQLKELFWREAEQHQVEPLDDRVAARIVGPKPHQSTAESLFEWKAPVTGIHWASAPNLLNTSYSIKAEITLPEEGAEGMLITQGGRFAGYGFYLLHNQPVFIWNLGLGTPVRWQGPPLTAGNYLLEFEFEYQGLGVQTVLNEGNMSGLGQRGIGSLKVNGKTVATEKMSYTLPFTLQRDQSLDIGSDTGSPVSDDYQIPFPFNGKLEQISVHLQPPANPAE